MTARTFNTCIDLGAMANHEIRTWIKRADELGLGDCVARGKRELASRTLKRSGTDRLPPAHYAMNVVLRHDTPIGRREGGSGTITVEQARAAVTCNACFENDALQRAGIGMPQPFTVGRVYASQRPRVVIVGLNPGASREGGYKEARCAVLERFRAGEDAALDDYALAAERDVPLWGNGKFLRRVKALGLDLPQIAFGNLALCATDGNRYPDEMLSRCYERHSAGMLKALAPHAVLIMGSAARKYVRPVAKLLPTAIVLPMMHFAHREGKAAEASECERMRELLMERQRPGFSLFLYPNNTYACQRRE